MMKKLLFTYTLLLFSIIVAYTQSITKEKYKNAIDYSACRITQNYIEKYIGKATATDKEKMSYDNIIKHRLRCTLDNSCIGYKELVNLLKENNFSIFAPQLDLISTKILNSFTQNLSKEDAIKLIIENGFYSNNSEVIDNIKLYDQSLDLKRELVDNLNKYLELQSSSKSNKERNKKVNKKSDVNRIEKNKPQDLKLWLFIVIILVLSIVSIVMSFLNFIFLRAQKKKVKYQNEIGDKLYSYNKDVGNICKRLEQKVGKLEQKVRKLEQQKNRTQHQVVVNNLPKREEKQQQQRKTVLYAQMPLDDGSFKVSEVFKEENKGNSYYKFSLVANSNNRAEFEFISNKSTVTNAINMPDQILTPVCNFKNARDKNAESIKTERPGIVIKQNDKWIVETKADISYK